MAIPIGSGKIYVRSPDHPERLRINSPAAVFSVVNVNN